MMQIFNEEREAMTEHYQDNLERFLDVLGLNEQPVGIFFTDKEPIEGFSPKPLPLPTREKEINNEIDWQCCGPEKSTSQPM